LNIPIIGQPLSSAGSRRNFWLAAALLVLAAFAAYHNTFNVPFLLDDEGSITTNPTIRQLWPIGPALSPPAGVGMGGRPLVNLSLAVNYACGGLAVPGYHALNLAIHLCAGLTLLGIMRRTFLKPVLRERFGGAALPLALAAALLWTLHPLQTESVTYVSQRLESLMGLFYLLTLYCFIRGTEASRPGRWYALTVVMCLLGMASKEVMVTAPLLVLLYDRTFVGGSFRSAWRQRWRLYLGLAGTWLLLGALLSGLHHRAVGFGLGVTPWIYALTECKVVVQYLGLAVWPHPLVFDYGGVNVDIVKHGTELAPYALVLGLCVAGTLAALWRRPVLGFAAGWFWLILAPGSSVVPLAGQPMAEHRLYLPLAAVAALGVAGLHTLGGRRSVMIFMILAAGLGALAGRRNADYRSALVLWSDTVAKCPGNMRARCNLGDALFQAGRVPEATAQFAEAVRLKPDYAEAHCNLGIALIQAGRMQEAIAHLQAALRFKPDDANSRYGLGLALMQLGRATEAIPYFQEALRLQPDDARGHNNLGMVLLRTGRVQEAMGQLTEAVRLKPDYFEARSNLGAALFQLGRVEEAVGQFEEAVRLKPGAAEAHFNLGIMLEQTGRRAEAREHYEQALRLKPDYAKARNNLARLRALPQVEP
jgi:Flp pilus assembly protein TadD